MNKNGEFKKCSKICERKQVNRLGTTEQTHKQDLKQEHLQTVFLEDNFDGVELILRHILGQEDIKIKSVRTQESMKNLEGCSPLDVHAVDSKNEKFNVEIQMHILG